MKKCVAIILITLLLIFSLTACSRNAIIDDTEQNDNRLSVIYNSGYSIIYVDNETGCQYFSRSDCGTCLMVDENGKPLIYGGSADAT